MLNIKKPNLKKSTLLLILSLCLNGCNNIPKPPDVVACKELTRRPALDPITLKIVDEASPVCMDQLKEPYCGVCGYIMSGKRVFIGNKKENYFHGKSWDTIKEESVLVPSKESYAPLATYMINACKKMKCDKQVEQFKINLQTK